MERELDAELRYHADRLTELNIAKGMSPSDAHRRAVLALGIGANTAIFSVVYGVLLRPLPYAQGGQLVVLHQNEAKANISDLGFSVKEISDYRDQSHTLQSVVEHHSMSFLLIGKDSAER